jgi:anti-sigma factor RsiW
MNCETTQTLLAAYLDGEVTPSEKMLIRAHLSNCTVCQQELNLLSTARGRVRSALQHRAGHAVPSAEAWNRLEAKLPKVQVSFLSEEAQPSSTQFGTWLSRLAPGVSRIFAQLISGGVTMQKQKILATGMSVLVIAVAAVLIFNSATPVSAQQILERAAAAQSAVEAGEGIWHTLVEVYENPQALEGDQAGATTMMESYTDASTGYSLFTTVDANGKLLEISANDETFNYFMMREAEEVDQPLIVHRTPISQDDLRKGAFGGNSSDMAESLFEHYKSNPRVELKGKENWGGRQVYLLVDPNFQTSKLPNGEEEKTFTGTMQMVFDAKTYELLESQTTVFKNDKEIVIEKVKFLVDETLPAETQVTWNLSDLQGVTFVDDAPQEVEAEDPVFTTISQEELATHPDTYVLSAIPDGFTQEIIESPEQPSGEPYRYEVHYNNAAGESFELMAVGFMDDGFVETSFYDGSYKTSSGKVLYYSSGTPVNSPKGTSAMLVTENGVSFLVFSTMPREQVETLVEDLVLLNK